MPPRHPPTSALRLGAPFIPAASGVDPEAKANMVGLQEVLQQSDWIVGRNLRVGARWRVG